MKNNDMIRPCESSTKPEGKIVNEEVDPWDAFMHLKSTRKNMKTLKRPERCILYINDEYIIEYP